MLKGWSAGNKGAIITSFWIAGSSFVYIKAHCAAGEATESKMKQRERDLAIILNAKPWSDFTFFAGDLNHRIMLPRSRVIDAVAKHDSASLIEHDELTKQRKDKTSLLSPYHEQPLTFDPT